MNQKVTCQNKGKSKYCMGEFEITPDDFTFYEKIDVPPPTFCPRCRLIRRLARRNERNFYYDTCKKCNKKIISVFSKDFGFNVYCGSCWYSDAWDGLEYGVDFDFSKDLFSQLNTLFSKVPVMNLYALHTTLVNSDYTNMVSWLKNCYMVTYSDFCENIIYGSFVNHSRDSVDNLMGKQLELCYETVNCSQCYNTFFSNDCESCTNVWFSKNCIGCMNCFGCVNLKSKSYHIFNKPYSKEEYENRMREFFPLSQNVIEKIQSTCQKFFTSHPQKYIHGWRNVESSGDYLNDTKNAKDCFIGFDIEDSRFCSFVTGKLTDTYDFVNFGEGSSRMYEVLQGGDKCSDIKMSQWAITNCYNLEYCLFCTSSQNLFGCVGLKKREYCIFNKQYTKEEYFILRDKIIKHMNKTPYVDKNGSTYLYGEFFPIDLSLCTYNDSTAQELFPLSKEEVIKMGYKWKDEESKDYKITLFNKDIPEKIDTATDFILNEIIECKHKSLCTDRCTLAFKITAEELQFYKKTQLPLPDLCPNCRHSRRLAYRNPMKLWKRACTNQNSPVYNGPCQNIFETSYDPDRKELVYCDECYKREVL